MRFVALMAARSRPPAEVGFVFSKSAFRKALGSFCKKAFSGGGDYAPGCAKPPGGKIGPMNYYGAKDLAGSFRTVRKNTITIAEEIGEQHYGFSPAPETRTVAQTLVHIGLGPRMAQQIHGVERRTSLEGFDFPGFLQKIISEERTQRNKEQIIAFLRAEGEKFAAWVDGLSEEFLGQHVAMPPGMQPASKSRFEMIAGVKEHEMHHRGQLMLMERMVGIVPHLTREMQARMAGFSAQAAGRPA
jgi:uncharacterized damage-inducible protein DinB